MALFTKEELEAIRLADLEIEEDFHLTNEDLRRSRTLDREAYLEAMDPEKRKVAAWNKAYREANKDKVAAQKKAYREANKDKVAAQQKAWYEANKDKVAAQQKAYREANKDKVAAQQKAWREKNPDYFRQRYQNRKQAAT